MVNLDKQLNALMINIIREKVIIYNLQALFEKHPKNVLVRILTKIHPNFLTISRVVIFPPIVIYFLVNNQKVTALIIWLLGWLTDPLDGAWATVTNKQTEFGKILDPICDRVYFVTVLFATLLISNLSLTVIWLLCIIFGLEFILPVLYLVAKVTTSSTPILEHNAFGKTKTFLLSVILPLIWFSSQVSDWQTILGVLSGAALLSSLVNIKRHLQKFQKNKS